MIANRHATALAYLRERLDEDARLIDQYEAYMIERCANAGSYVLALPPGWQSGEPFDPGRQRAEIDAKRRIVARAEQYERWAANEGTPAFKALAAAGRMMVQYSALPYAGRDDFPDMLRLPE